MRRLPVLETIRQAYGFTYAHLGAIIGVIWLPMVVSTVTGFFVNQHYSAQIQAATASGNAAAAGPAVLAMLAYLLAKLLLTAMMYVPVAQLALGQRQDGAMLYFTFGALEWRLFRTLLGLMLFLAPPALLLMLVGQNVLATGVAAAGPRLLGAELMFLLLYAALVFVAVRIAALLVPVVVAGDKTPLIRSWTLSSKNFWRLLGVLVGALGPVMLVVAIIEVALLQAAGVSDAAAATQLTMANGPNAPLIAGLEFLLAPLLIGLSVGASVFAWKALSKTDLSV